MNNKQILEWLKLPDRTKKSIFTETAGKLGLPEAAIEKDWWVVRTLELVFQTEIAEHTVFKGGTSLSKAWGLIDRLSEDIDLALDRKFLGFEETLSKSQVKRLREKSLKYISENYYLKLQQIFSAAGFKDIEFKLADIKANDQDPLIIEIYYPVVTENSGYLQPKVQIEIGSRSLREPFTEKSFCSFVGEQFKGRNFADDNIIIPTVNPERTFLEKIFLLHEEFQQEKGKIRVDRLSRHLYDLEKLMDTEFTGKALTDMKLYEHIVEHRKTITPLRGMNYNNHTPDKIRLIPPDEFLNEWKNDYEKMKESMIYGKSLPFDMLIERLTELNKRINSLKW